MRRKAVGKFTFIDISLCINCHECEAACASEHRGRSFMTVIPVNETYSVPLNCRHCEKAPCAASCPTKAITRTAEGIVVIDIAKCNGCRLCAEFCPFGMLVWDPKSRVMRKCDMCRHRLKEGKEPACVAACCTGALIYAEWDSVMQRRKEEAARAIAEGGEVRLGFLLGGLPELKWK